MGDACFEELPTDDAAAQPVADRGPLVSVPEPPPRRESDDLRAAEELRARLKWFLLGRVAVISGFLAMVTVAYLGSARERFDVPVNDLLLVVAAAYAFSALSAILLPHLQRADAIGAQEPPVEARPANGNGHGSPVRSCDAERSGATWAPDPPRAAPPVDCVDLERDLAEYEKAILLRALDQAGGVKKRAAELLGINYRSLRHRLQKYGLSDGDDGALVQ